jgi:hypothetical protein
MSEITNTDYITINTNGIFVGGKPAETYRDDAIRAKHLARNYFADIREINPDVAELHVLSSETRGKYGVMGNPSKKHGPNAWCRVKFENGKTTSWVFAETTRSVAHCASYCATRCVYYCANACTYYVSSDASFRSAVFGEIDNTKNTQKKPVLARLVEKLKNRQH